MCETCVTPNLCGRARKKMAELSAGHLATLYDARIFEFLYERDQEGIDNRPAGAIAACVANNPDCVWNKLYLDADWETGESGVEERPSAGNLYAGLG